MPRPVWSDRAPDVAAVAALLEEAARQSKGTAGDLEPRDSGGADPVVLHQAALARARQQLSRRHSEQDRVLAQEVRAVDDLVRSANLLVERLREWYALHAPEAVRLEGDAEALARLVAEHADREAVLGALQQADLARTSFGSDLPPEDLAVLQAFATSLRSLHEAWRALERRIGALMDQVAPNLAAVVGPMLGARLVAQAGSLERLATWPGGTVQLLGAETALFRHLKEGSRPPKHGVLFQHPAIHTAPPWQRGPIARVLAQSATTAARADAFTQRDLREELAARVKKDLARVRAERAKRPERAPAKGKAPGARPPGGRPGKGGTGRGGRQNASGGAGRSKGKAGPGRRSGPERGEGAPRRQNGAPRHQDGPPRRQDGGPPRRPDGPGPRRPQKAGKRRPGGQGGPAPVPGRGD